MTKVKNLFYPIDLEKLVSDNKVNFIVTIGCPNYEERSISCLMDINKYASKNNSLQLIKNEILFLKNRRNNNLVLEELKSQYCNTLKNNLSKESGIVWYKIDYPNNYNLRGLITKLSRTFKKYSTERKIDLLIDISAMPQRIIFGLCESVSDWLLDEHININSICFSCVSPQKFSQLPYAQEIGILSGLFAGEPIAINGQQDIRTVIFPSMTGHESKLLLDELNQIAHEQKNAIFLQIDADDFLTSLEIMRANQILMEHGDTTQYYYCSPYDAIKELINYFNKEENERKSTSPASKRLYLVAPFGSKIMLPISFFILKQLKEHSSDFLDIEICHALGFQYTSVYSIGVGETCTFQFNIDEWQQK